VPPQVGNDPYVHKMARLVAAQLACCLLLVPIGAWSSLPAGRFSYSFYANAAKAADAAALDDDARALSNNNGTNGSSASASTPSSSHGFNPSSDNYTWGPYVDDTLNGGSGYSINGSSGYSSNGSDTDATSWGTTSGGEGGVQQQPPPASSNPGGGGSDAYEFVAFILWYVLVCA
jgi:hypothetical protein